MKKLIIECDCYCCKKDFRPSDGAEDIEFWFGSYMDPAEGIKPDVNTLDLCQACTSKLARQCLRRLSDKEQEDLYNIFKAGQ
jgi:hypothetical protein